MKLYGLEQIYEAALTVLSYPAAMIAGIWSNIAAEFHYINRVITAGKIPGPIMIWNQIKWVLLLLLIILVVFLLLRNTILGLLNTERPKERGLLFESFIIVLTLCVYYSLIAIGLYLLFNVIIPIALEL